MLKRRACEPEKVVVLFTGLYLKTCILIDTAKASLNKSFEAKKKNKSVSCSRSQNCNAECGFLFFFSTIHEKAMRNAIFIFLNKTSGRKYIKTIALVSFLTFNKNITGFI